MGVMQGAPYHKRPRAIFLTGPRVTRSIFLKDLLDSGIQADFVESVSELERTLDDPRVFAVFIDLDLPQCQSVGLISKMKNHRCKWTVIAKPLKMAQSQTLFSAGAADIVQHPVHPVTLKNRLKLLLTRYLRQHDMPEDVVLPAGVNPKDLKENPSSISPQAVEFNPEPSGDFLDSSQKLPGDDTGSRLLALTKELSLPDPRTLDLPRPQKAPPGIETLVDKPIVRSEEYIALKKVMSEKSYTLRFDRIPNPRKWPSYVPFLSQDAKQELSSTQRKNLLQKVFSDAALVTGAQQAMLLSLKPYTSSRQLPPEKLYALIHSSDPLEYQRSIKSELLPQIEVALEIAQPISVDEPTPVRIGNEQREKFWCVHGELGEEASAVIPLFDKNIPFAVVLLQFASPIEEKQNEIIEESCFIFNQMKLQCLVTDYFCRIYREAVY